MKEKSDGPADGSKQKYQYQRELQKQRDRTEIANQLVRSGLVMNGGGSIALLAFIQASIESDSFVVLAQWAAISILVFVIGLGAVGVANFLRILVSLENNKPNSFGKRFWIQVSRCLQLGSTLLFMLGCAVFTVGIFQQLGFPNGDEHVTPCTFGMYLPQKLRRT